MTPTNVVMPDGREWRYLGRGEVEARDGGQRATWRFETSCRACGRPFEMDTLAPRPTAHRSGAFGLVHCQRHRLRFRPSTKPKRVAERIRMRSGHVWTLVDRTWYRSKRGKMLRMGVYSGSCRVCASEFTVTSKLHCVGRNVSNYLRTVRCRQCRERHLPPIPGADLV